jgi:hypothetical protein
MERVFRLYKQEPLNKKRLGEYVLRWVCWIRSGLRISLNKKGRTKQTPCLLLVDKLLYSTQLMAVIKPSIFDKISLADSPLNQSGGD